MTEAMESRVPWQAMTRMAKIRASEVVVLSATSIERDILPELYDECRSMGQVDQLDVVLITRGGVVNDARRIALMLRAFARRVTFIVPHYCESSGTLLAISGDEVIAGDLAIFSPIDPHLCGGSDGNEEGTASVLSWLDLAQFPKMANEWFGIDSSKYGCELLSLVCASVSAPTLTTFYRVSEEMREIAVNLLARPLHDRPLAERQYVADMLIGGFRSHNYAITRDELKNLGLNILRDPNIEDLGWEIARATTSILNAAVAADTWNDVLLATRTGARVRSRQAGGQVTRWVRTVAP